MTTKCLHNESFRVMSIWHDSRHASASIPIPSTPWNGAREDSGIIKITWVTWIKIINLEHLLSTQRSAESRISTGRPMAPTYSFTSCRRCVISQWSLVISQKTRQKKSQSSFGPLMTTSTSQMASLVSNWQIPNQQQSIISHTSNCWDFCAVAPSIFSVWSSWRERILDILKGQRWI